MKPASVGGEPTEICPASAPAWPTVQTSPAKPPKSGQAPLWAWPGDPQTLTVNENALPCGSGHGPHGHGAGQLALACGQGPNLALGCGPVIRCGDGEVQALTPKGQVELGLSSGREDLGHFTAGGRLGAHLYMVEDLELGLLWESCSR